jgi:hypothetical protein
MSYLDFLAGTWLGSRNVFQLSRKGLRIAQLPGAGAQAANGTVFESAYSDLFISTSESIPKGDFENLIFDVGVIII